MTGVFHLWPLWAHQGCSLFVIGCVTADVCTFLWSSCCESWVRTHDASTCFRQVEEAPRPLGSGCQDCPGEFALREKAPLETACQDCFGSFPGGPKMAGVYSPPALTGVYSGELENSLRWIYFPVCHGDFTFWKYTGTSSVRKAVVFECSLRLVQLPEALFCVRR